METFNIISNNTDYPLTENTHGRVRTITNEMVNLPAKGLSQGRS